MALSAARPQGRLPWRTASVAVMRMAGFPFSWLDQISAPGTVAAAARLQRAVGQVDSFASIAASAEARRSLIVMTSRPPITVAPSGYVGYTT
jgi:hypothetical protein